MKFRSVFGLVLLAVAVFFGAGLLRMKLESPSTPESTRHVPKSGDDSPTGSPRRPAAEEAATAGENDEPNPRPIPESHRQYRAGEQYRLRSGVTVRIFHKKRNITSRMTMADSYGPRYLELLPLAESGDAQAQLDLGLVLDRCANIPEDIKTLENVIASVHKTRRYLGGIKVEDPLAQEKSLREESRRCAGIAQEQRGRARDWVKAAADAGLLAAQEELSSVFRPGDVYYLWTRNSPEANAQDAADYRESTAYLEKARAAGSVEVLWWLGNRFRSTHKDDPPWEREPYDPVKAWAHFLAADELNEVLGRNRDYASTLNSVTTELPGKMTLNQQLQAQALARSFLENPLCCVVTGER